MKRLILLFTGMVLLSIGAAAQNIHYAETIPEEAAKVLESRLQAMLKAGGVADAPLDVDAVVTERMETTGSIAGLALTLELKLVSGEASATFVLKGVGADEADAWIRACKQFLPRSQATKEFTDKLLSR